MSTVISGRIAKALASFTGSRTWLNSHALSDGEGSVYITDSYVIVKWDMSGLPDDTIGAGPLGFKFDSKTKATEKLYLADMFDEGVEVPSDLDWNRALETYAGLIDSEVPVKGSPLSGLGEVYISTKYLKRVADLADAISKAMGKRLVDENGITVQMTTYAHNMCARIDSPYGTFSITAMGKRH